MKLDLFHRINRVRLAVVADRLGDGAIAIQWNGTGRTYYAGARP